jgi:predicted transcriptional regulator
MNKTLPEEFPFFDDDDSNENEGLNITRDSIESDMDHIADNVADNAPKTLAEKEEPLSEEWRAAPDIAVSVGVRATTIHKRMRMMLKAGLVERATRTVERGRHGAKMKTYFYRMADGTKIEDEALMDRRLDNAACRKEEVPDGTEVEINPIAPQRSKFEKLAAVDPLQEQEAPEAPEAESLDPVLDEIIAVYERISRTKVPEHNQWEVFNLWTRLRFPHLEGGN